jgi:Uma2 family endonuclease
MSTRMILPATADIDYPEDDGLPRAENTLQFPWIVTLQGNLDDLFRADINVFVAGDLLWYPVEGDNTIRTAPDVLAVFGRPKGYRSCYRQWEEGDIAPQVGFEVLSPGNRPGEMEEKFAFYERYGVEEYYVIEPHRNRLSGWLRQGTGLQPIARIEGWVSPRLGIRFEIENGEIRIYHSDGRRFATFLEITERAEQQRRDKEAALARAERERQDKEAARARAEQERREKEAAQARAERLAAQLRALGIAPEGPN